MNLTFNTIDVESAHPTPGTVCQIGVVHVVDGEIADRWETLVNPEYAFYSRNVDVHGIEPASVDGSPTILALEPKLRMRLDRGEALISHGSFDRTSMDAAFRRYRLAPLQVRWLDSTVIARRAWPRLQGHRLDQLASYLGFRFGHHNALEDAVAAARVFLAACRDAALDVDGWLEAVGRPGSATPEPNRDGAHFGRGIAFCGSLTDPQRELALYAAQAGFVTKATVTRQVDVLVVGRVIAGRRPSKQLRAETLMEQGHAIEIWSETRFFAMVGDRPQR